MEALNTRLFLWINGTAHSPETVVRFAQWCAENLIYIVLLLPFAAYLGRPRPQWVIVARAVAAVACAMFLKHVVSEFYFHPRPFMVPVGYTFGEHALTTSYPSAHGVLSLSVVLALLFARRWIWGILAACCAGLIIWARMYVGFHFPLDMAGAFGVALASNLVVLLVMRSFRQTRHVDDLDNILIQEQSMLQPQDVEKMIRQVLPCSHLQVEGDGQHFFAEIVSEAFMGKNRLARHRLVKDGLKDKIASNELHALSISVAATPEEWAARQ